MNLAPLPDVKRLSPACIRILGGNPGKFTLQGTNTYLLGSGKRRILIDSGEGKPAWAASLKGVLEAEDATVDILLLSHWHHDHVGGIEDLRKISPHATVYKYDPTEGQTAILNGQIFRVEGVTLTAHHTPGHTTDHLVFTLAEENAMFTADNVLGEGTAVFEDMATYLNSLHQMKMLFRGRAYPGHGELIEKGPDKITEYIKHRKQREEQVVQVMRSTKSDGSQNWTGMEVVKIIYREVHEDLHLAACAGVLQILRKLEQEGRAARADDGDSWVLAGQAAL
ncbi:Beta-lactamase-like protein [Cordyceps fumosorosea ARSEF 2679]|uniref:Beta-lactamase-like protein n=1 Tax=Cordyceps fumosorosea (strain ARSEF 2679) TaxID=1081104 RepID=A0A168EFT9_CORFA|nr:Beta-lactamase-like protein [Cordyceps fumosorosea ARSEF 2679]OAA73757.1 Beta-lactamase-like protein [Cordyceps fumosorosea ARSEF 2679]